MNTWKSAEKKIYGNRCAFQFCCVSSFDGNSWPIYLLYHTLSIIFLVQARKNQIDFFIFGWLVYVCTVENYGIGTTVAKQQHIDHSNDAGPVYEGTACWCVPWKCINYREDTNTFEIFEKYAHCHLDSGLYNWYSRPYIRNEQSYTG